MTSRKPRDLGKLVDKEEFIRLFRILTTALIAHMRLVVDPRSITNSRGAVMEIVARSFSIDVQKLEEVISGQSDLKKSYCKEKLEPIWDQYALKARKVMREDSKRELLDWLCYAESFSENVRRAQKWSIIKGYLADFRKIFIDNGLEAKKLQGYTLLLDNQALTKLAKIFEALPSKKKLKSDAKHLSDAEQSAEQSNDREIQTWSKQPSTNGKSRGIQSSAPKHQPYDAESEMKKGDVYRRAMESQENQMLLMMFFNRSPLKTFMSYDYVSVVHYLSTNVGRDPDITLAEIESKVLSVSELIESFDQKTRNDA